MKNKTIKKIILSIILLTSIKETFAWADYLINKTSGAALTFFVSGAILTKAANDGIEYFKEKKPGEKATSEQSISEEKATPEQGFFEKRASDIACGASKFYNIFKISILTASVIAISATGKFGYSTITTYFVV
jgi:hypothetical protein